MKGLGHHSSGEGDSRGTPDTRTPDTSHVQNPDVSHEQSDVNVRGIIKFIMGLTIATTIVFLIVWGMFRLLVYQSTQQQPPPSALARRGEERLPPEPRLQLAPGHEAHPLMDMANLRREWNQQLENYGWIDRSAGSVHIPIDNAKRLMLERNMFPSRPNAPVEIADEQIPSYSSSGRQPERRLQ